jgi:hypothetical protein
MSRSRRRLRRHLDSHGFCDITARRLSAARPAHTPVSDPFVTPLSLPTGAIGSGHAGVRMHARD